MKLALILLVFFMVSCSSPQPETLSPVEEAARQQNGYVALTTKVVQTTDDGATVYSHSGLNIRQLSLIDAAITELYLDTLEDGFKSGKTVLANEVEVYTPPYICPLSPEGRIPSFLVNSGKSYDGSQYDQYNPKGYGVKDGMSVIYAAEQVLSYGGGLSKTKIYICPDEGTIKEATKHGLEHVFLKRYPYTEENRATFPYDGSTYFNCSVNHSSGIIIHPLLPRKGRCEVQ